MDVGIKQSGSYFPFDLKIYILLSRNACFYKAEAN